MGKSIQEHSAGGIVLKVKTISEISSRTKVLMIQVKNLLGQIAWTFPKGHLEQNEKDWEAAFREVQEETGWECELLSYEKRKYFEKVYYRFFRDNKPVAKTVTWYLMTPRTKVSEKDVQEVLKARWVSLEKAQKMVRYPSDKKLLEKLGTAPYLAK